LKPSFIQLVKAMGTLMCPNKECPFDKQLHPKELCPLCGRMTQELEFKALGTLFKAKWACKKKMEEKEAVKRVLKRTKYCPRCGSAKVFWAQGLPQLWSIWDCQNCGYRGALIIEDGKLASRIRKDYELKKKETIK